MVALVVADCLQVPGERLRMPLYAHPLMKDANNLGGVVAQPIDDDVSADEKKAVGIRQIWAGVAQPGVLFNQLQGIREFGAIDL